MHIVKTELFAEYFPSTTAEAKKMYRLVDWTFVTFEEFDKLLSYCVKADVEFMESSEVKMMAEVFEGYGSDDMLRFGQSMFETTSASRRLVWV